jgi:protein-tyrosine phosphatase
MEDYSTVKVDMHSHLIPAIDDGVQAIEESVTIIRSLKNMGYEKIITTPHIMSSMYENNPDIIRSGLDIVKSKLKEENIDIQIECAAEYYVDDTFEKRMNEEELLTFGEKYILVEKSMFEESVNFKDIAYKLLCKDYRVIVAHPERYKYMYEKKSIYQFEELKESGVWLQLNLFSLAGLYGSQSQEIAEKLIDADLIDFVSSDIHNPTQLEYFRKALKSPYLDKLCKSESLLNVTLL